jgi:UTP--glucose-1-phosphate uridylyltransferase
MIDNLDAAWFCKLFIYCTLFWWEVSLSVDVLHRAPLSVHNATQMPRPYPAREQAVSVPGTTRYTVDPSALRAYFCLCFRSSFERLMQRCHEEWDVVVRKAVITAAAKSQRALPLQTLIDRDGNEKSLLRILIEQSLAAGVENIAIVVYPGDEHTYALSAGTYANSVVFIPQREPRGYGHAVHCAQAFTKDDPFLHIVGDHLYVSTDELPSALRMVQLAQRERCSVSGVRLTRESLLSRFGAVAGRRIPQQNNIYRIDTVIEKPTPTEAEQRLLVSGIRSGYYLCFSGIHILTPAVMEILGRKLAADAEARLTLVDALAVLARQEHYLAIEDAGRRYDLGAPYGLLIAQLALALNGRNRGEVLTQMLELFADRELDSNGRVGV